MKAKVITALVLVLFAGLAIWSYTTQQNKLQLQQVELQRLNIDKKVLESESVKRKRTIDQLNSRIEELHKSGNADKSKIDQLNKQLENAMQQLQAKAEEKKRLAKASSDIINVATNTRVASAAPVASGNIQQIIVDAANRYGVDPNRALRIAKCESGFNPNAVNYGYNENGNPSGLYQHISGYWAGRAAKYGYAGASVFDPVANANVTMGMWRDGQSNLWECM